MPANLGVRLIHLEPAPQQAHPLHRQASGLPPAKSGKRQHSDQRLVPGRQKVKLRDMRRWDRPL